MPPTLPAATPSSASGRHSTSTLWSVIELAQGSNESAVSALDQLVDRYRPVIRKYLGERLRDFDPENAEATLAHLILPKLVHQATRRSRKGSFRRLLRLAVNAYVVDTLRRSTLQTGSWPRIESEDLIDAADLAEQLSSARRGVARHLAENLPVAALRLLALWRRPEPVPLDLRRSLVAALDHAVQDTSLWVPSRFAGIRLRPETETLATTASTATDVQRLNRLLLEDAFPLALARRADETRHASRELFDPDIIESVLDQGDDPFEADQPGDAMDQEFALRTFREACRRFRLESLERKGMSEIEFAALLPLPDPHGRVPSLHELSATLGITPAALKVRQCRARRTLRALFGQCVADIVAPRHLEQEVLVLEALLRRTFGVNPFHDLKPTPDPSE